MDTSAWRFALQTETREHDRNDDRGFCGEIVNATGTVWWAGCVADGVGSLPAGNQVAEWLVGQFQQELEASTASGAGELVEILRAWSRRTQEQVWERWGAEYEGASTFTACVSCETALVVVHIGDCLAFWTDGCTCRRLTRPQNAANTRAMDTEEDILDSKTLEHGFGVAGPDDPVAVTKIPYPAPSGWLLVMSDGVHGLLGGGDLLNAAAQAFSSDDLAAKVLAVSKEHGVLLRQQRTVGRLDNATVAVLRLGDPPGVPMPTGGDAVAQPTAISRRKITVTAAAALVLLLIVLLGWQGYHVWHGAQQQRFDVPPAADVRPETVQGIFLWRQMVVEAWTPWGGMGLGFLMGLAGGWLLRTLQPPESVAARRREGSLDGGQGAS